MTFRLNPAVSPQQNAAKFYKDYQKAKTAEKVLTEQIAKGEAELSYLASVLDELSRVESERDMQDIRQELTDGGYLRETGQKKKMKLPASKPMVFRSSDGFEILVGRNNRQNDLLTCKLAQKQDIWLHTQKIHGSHVIIACAPETPPDRTVTEAMQLAVYFSQAREGQNVPVDYTRVKNVKKPAGAKPGMVDLRPLYDRRRHAGRGAGGNAPGGISMARLARTSTMPFFRTQPVRIFPVPRNEAPRALQLPVLLLSALRARDVTAAAISGTRRKRDQGLLRLHDSAREGQLWARHGAAFRSSASAFCRAGPDKGIKNRPASNTSA